jgi:hypothetical protein
MADEPAPEAKAIGWGTIARTPPEGARFPTRSLS